MIWFAFLLLGNVCYADVVNSIFVDSLDCLVFAYDSYHYIWSFGFIFVYIIY